jgi:hypothetical protein
MERYSPLMSMHQLLALLVATASAEHLSLCELQTGKHAYCRCQ